MQDNIVGEYKQIYEVATIAGLTTIKIKIIQALIQIRRPTNWNCTNIESLINNFVKTERHNFKTNHLMPNFEKMEFLNKMNIISFKTTRVTRHLR
jgi:hypothetical protein